MMDKRLTVIYADAAEKFVKNVVLYAYPQASGESTPLYYDEACTEVVNGKYIENFFLKGLLIGIKADAYEGVLYATAGSYTTNENNAVVSVIADAEELLLFSNPIVEEETEAEEEAE